MVKEDPAAILKQGVEAWNKWRSEHFDTDIVLSGTDLSETDLSRMDLSRADLSWANLRGANLRGANLRGTKFIAADLRGAKFIAADLSKAILIGARLNGADLDGANLSYAVLLNTIVVNVDLSTVKGLELVRHLGESTINIDTIYRSQGKIPEVFLRGAGIPENFITYMHSLTTNAFEFYSCFISYSSKDEEFVTQLHTDMQSKGVQSWYAPEEMKTGARILQTIFDQIRLHEKLLIVISENSLASPWVEDEVDKAIEEERQNNRQMLFPIRLDNIVMETDKSWAAKIRHQRHISDFTGWKNRDTYLQSFDRLMRDLKVEKRP